MTAIPRALVLTGNGINCDIETELAFRMAGAGARRVHINDLAGGIDRLDYYQILCLPGGFSFGDDIAAGKVLAVEMHARLGGGIREFVEDDKLVIGICNGAQAAVKYGLLPGYSGYETQETTFTYNDSGRFEDRWVSLAAHPWSPCVFTKGIDKMYLPVRHGEGKFCVQGKQGVQELEQRDLVALRYWDDGHVAVTYPENPNGSVNGIAGLCDPTGRIFAMMPHPEAYVHPWQHPRWTRLKHAGKLPVEGDGMRIFRNAVRYFE